MQWLTSSLTSMSAPLSKSRVSTAGCWYRAASDTAVLPSCVEEREGLGHERCRFQGREQATVPPRSRAWRSLSATTSMHLPWRPPHLIPGRHVCALPKKHRHHFKAAGACAFQQRRAGILRCTPPRNTPSSAQDSCIDDPGRALPRSKVLRRRLGVSFARPLPPGLLRPCSLRQSPESKPNMHSSVYVSVAWSHPVLGKHICACIDQHLDRLDVASCRRFMESRAVSLEGQNREAAATRCLALTVASAGALRWASMATGSRRARRGGDACGRLKAPPSPPPSQASTLGLLPV